MWCCRPTQYLRVYWSALPFKGLLLLQRLLHPLALSYGAPHLKHRLSRYICFISSDHSSRLPPAAALSCSLSPGSSSVDCSPSLLAPSLACMALTDGFLSYEVTRPVAALPPRPWLYVLLTFLRL